MIELRQQLDKERSVRMMLEEQVRSLEAHMYPEKLKVIAQQVQLQQQQEQVRLLHQEKLEREQQHLRTQVRGDSRRGPLGCGGDLRIHWRALDCVGANRHAAFRCFGRIGT